MKWLTQVMVLLLRSRPLRGLLIISGLAAALLSTTASSIAMLQPSPQQTAMANLGAAQARIDLADITIAPGAVPTSPHWIGQVEAGVNLITVLEAQVSLRSGESGDATHVMYRELELPSKALEGRVELFQGRWPSDPGECVGTAGLAKELNSPIGSWHLTATGTVRPLLEADDLQVVYCAPGTWKLWSLSSAEAAASGAAASTVYYLDGATDSVATSMQQLLDAGVINDYNSISRTQVLGERGLSPSRFLATRLPLLALPGALAAVLAGIVAQWGAAVAAALERVGLPRRPLRVAMLSAVALGAFASTVVGATAGLGLAMIVRPALAWLNHGVPLSQWTLDPALVASLALISAVGAALGHEVGNGLRGAQLRQSRSVDRQLTPGGTFLLASIAVAAVGTSVWLAWASDGRTWWMVAAPLAMLGASVSASGLVVSAIARRWSVQAPSPKVLAARILVDNSRHWAMVTAAFTVIIGLVSTAFVTASASTAGQIAMSRSLVPKGSVMIETRNPAGEAIQKSVLRRFEQELGLSDPIRLTEFDVTWGDAGLIQFFDDLESAKRVLGPLDDSALATLGGGGVVALGLLVPSGPTELETPNGAHALEFVTINPSPAHRFATGAGFAVVSAMPDAFSHGSVLRTWNVYLGLPEETDPIAREWSAVTGLGAFQIMAYRPQDPFSLPLWTALALVGFGVFMVPLVASVIGREARALRPLAARLNAVGTPPRWTRSVFLWLGQLLVWVPVLLGALGALVSTAILVAIYPTVFDLTGVPWWVGGTFGLAVAAAGFIAAWIAIRKLDSHEREVTV